MTHYEKRANEFLSKNNATIKKEYLTHDKYFIDDTQCRDIWKLTIKRNGKSYTTKFGQSIVGCGEEPSNYDILACLTKYETPCDIWDFAKEFGYEIKDKESYYKVSKICKACQREYKGVMRLFGDVLEELQEIE